MKDSSFSAEMWNLLVWTDSDSANPANPTRVPIKNGPNYWIFYVSNNSMHT